MQCACSALMTGCLCIFGVELRCASIFDVWLAYWLKHHICSILLLLRPIKLLICRNKNPQNFMQHDSLWIHLQASILIADIPLNQWRYERGHRDWCMAPPKTHCKPRKRQTKNLVFKCFNMRSSFKEKLKCQEESYLHVINRPQSFIRVLMSFKHHVYTWNTSSKI